MLRHPYHTPCAHTNPLDWILWWFNWLDRYCLFVRHFNWLCTVSIDKVAASSLTDTRTVHRETYVQREEKHIKMSTSKLRLKINVEMILNILENDENATTNAKNFGECFLLKSLRYLDLYIRLKACWISSEMYSKHKFVFQKIWLTHGMRSDVAKAKTIAQIAWNRRYFVVSNVNRTIHTSIVFLLHCERTWSALLLLL